MSGGAAINEMPVRDVRTCRDMGLPGTGWRRRTMVLTRAIPEEAMGATRSKDDFHHLIPPQIATPGSNRGRTLLGSAWPSDATQTALLRSASSVSRHCAAENALTMCSAAYKR
jgi:hypothetical protein